MPELRNSLRWNSLPAMLLDLSRQRGDRPMLRHWADGRWHQTSWAMFAGSVASVAAGLRRQGIAATDRVLLVSENRPEFIIAETAILSLGAIAVPTYVTNTTEDHAHILRDSGACAAIVSTAVLAARIVAASADTPLKLLVVMEPSTPPIQASVTWQLLTADPGDPVRLMADVALLQPDDLACLLYTSGTGGLPKGVMLPHRSMLANQSGLAEAVARLKLDGERYLSFLPLSHAYEHTIGNYLLPSLGMEVVYSRGADRLAVELREIEPAFVTAVPRLFEVLRVRITAELARQPRWKQMLFGRALALGLRRLDGPRLTVFQRIEDAVLDRLVRRKVCARFGARLVALVSGGARLDPDLSGFFLALGVPVLQGYGQTEAGPVISVNLPWDNDRRSVGRPLPGVSVRVAEDGELLVGGALVMTGYWNSPAETAGTLRCLPPEPGASSDASKAGSAWLNTGDIGSIEHGRLVIHDRRRDFIKLTGGDMVSPARIESLLMAEPEVAQAVIAGEGRQGIVALLVAAEGADPALAPAEALARVNAKLSRIERIRGWHGIPPCTIENGLLTPTMKLKRRLVLERYAREIAALYPDSGGSGQA